MTLYFNSTANTSAETSCTGYTVNFSINANDTST
jgi:hypothetical protein